MPPTGVSAPKIEDAPHLKLLSEVEVAINKDRRACADLQRQLVSLKRTFSSSTEISTSVGTIVSDALTRASRFSDSVLPGNITQLVRSSLDCHDLFTPHIVENLRGILDNLKCPDEREISCLVPEGL